jgi:hypothetical protein
MVLRLGAIQAMLLTALFIAAQIGRAGEIDRATAVNCRRMDFIQHAEDFAVAKPLGAVFAANSRSSTGGLRALRVGKGGEVERIPVRMSNWPGGRLVAHGLDFLQQDGKSYLFVVNLGATPHSIEVFRARTTSTGLDLAWEGAIKSKVVTSPNDVRALSLNEVFVSNDWVNGLVEQWGNIVKCQFKPKNNDDLCESAFENGKAPMIKYANGLASYTQGSRRFLLNAATLDNAVEIYQVSDNGRLVPYRSIRLRFGPDNIHFDGESRLWIASLPEPRKIILREAIPFAFHIPSQISYVPFGSGAGREVQVFHDDGRMINAATAAVFYNGLLFMTAVSDQRSYACALNLLHPHSFRRPKSQRTESRNFGEALHGLYNGFNPASISLRRASRNGGSDSLRPSASTGSSAAKPGPSVAISNKTPLGSRK